MELSLLFLTLPIAVVFLCLVWFFLFADTDLVLALAEKFGRSATVFRGKVIWLTGASSGLGEAMAYELASVGAKLVLTARNETRLVQVKNKCLEISQGKLDSRDILVLPFDITDNAVHKKNFNDVFKHFEQIDVLLNNAGITQNGLTGDTDLEVDRAIFDVNFFGTISLTKLLIRHFQDTGNGQIIVISSILGKFGIPGAACYTATKHALHGYYESLRMEYHNKNIDVTMVCPAFFESGILSAVKGTRIGENVHVEISRIPEMETSRCAHLALVAAANRLSEVWMSIHPFLFLLYLCQYTPDVFRHAILMFWTKSRVKEACTGKFPSGVPSWKPFFQ